jgi:putative PEP-CTERM system TPR-repeat lipoprotein
MHFKLLPFIFYCLLAGTGLTVSLPAYADPQLDYEKALSSYKDQQYDDAMIHLKNALRSAPDNLPSKILMGKLLYQLGYFTTAKREFDEALNQGAEISLFADIWGETLLKLKAYEEIIEFSQFSTFSNHQLVAWMRIRAQACIQAKNFLCARASYKKISELSTNKVEQLNGLANIELLQKHYQNAEELLAQALKISPNNPITWQFKGLVAKGQNNLDDALRFLQTAFELDPDAPLILRHLADVYLATNNQVDAQKTIDRILLSTPNDPFAILVNSWLQQDTSLQADAEVKFQEMAAKITSLPNEYVNEDQALLFLRGLVSFREAKYTEAIRDFTNLRRLDDQDISPVILLAKSYIALNKPKDAIELLEAEISNLQALPSVLAILADLYINEGKNFKAAPLVASLQEQYPDDLSINLLAAKLDIARGRIESGMQKLDQLVLNNPQNEGVLFAHSVLSLQIQNFEAAAKSITSLLTLKPNEPVYLNIKAAVLIKQNKIQQAQDILLKVVNSRKDLYAAHINLGTTYYLQKNYLAAEDKAYYVLAHNPDQDAALLLMAQILLAQDKFEEAKRYFQQVLSKSRNNIAALEGLVAISVKNDNEKDALLNLSRLRLAAPHDPKYIIQKAQIYLSQNQHQEAAEQIQILANMAQNNAALLIALSKLQLSNNNLTGAIATLKRTQELQPNSLRVALQLAQLMLDNQLSQEAEQQLALMAPKFKNQADVVFLQGRLAEQQNKLELANQYYLHTLKLDDNYELALGKLYALTLKGMASAPFEDITTQLVEKYPQRYFPRNLLAQFYYYQQNYPLAIKHYKLLLAHKNQNNQVAILSRLAHASMPTDLAAAKNYAEQAYKLDNTSYHSLIAYGWVLTQLDQASQGLALLRKAAARHHQTPALYYYIAVSLDKLGLHKEAKSELDSLFAQNVYFNELEDAKNLYQKLQQM